MAKSVSDNKSQVWSIRCRLKAVESIIHKVKFNEQKISECEFSVKLIKHQIEELKIEVGGMILSSLAYRKSKKPGTHFQIK